MLTTYFGKNFHFCIKFWIAGKFLLNVYILNKPLHSLTPLLPLINWCIQISPELITFLAFPQHFPALRKQTINNFPLRAIELSFLLISIFFYSFSRQPFFVIQCFVFLFLFSKWIKSCHEMEKLKHVKIDDLPLLKTVTSETERRLFIFSTEETATKKHV